MRRTPRYLTAALLAVALPASACGPYLDTPMHVAKTDVLKPPDGKALVVFVRPGDDDIFWNIHVAVAEEDGSYVAAVGRGERVAVAVEPGRHVYYLFRGAAVMGENAPTVVAVVEAAAGKMYVLRTNLSVGEGRYWGTQQQRQQTVNQATAIAGLPAGTMVAGMQANVSAEASVAPIRAREEADKLLHATKPYEVDRSAAHDYETNGSRGQKEFWTNGVAGGKGLLSKLDAQKLEYVTLHEDQGFEP